MFHQAPPTERAINALPLNFVPASQQWREVFTDTLLSIWVQLAESGSLATLPPVPDIVGFANDCLAFFLIYHTNPPILEHPPGTESASSAPPESESVSSPRRGSGRRWHPYARPSSSTSRTISDRDVIVDPFGDQETQNEPEPQTPNAQVVIGCVYLALSSATHSTVDIGIALRPDARGRGYGRAALAKVTRYAFETLRMHRVVANVFGPSLGQPTAVLRAAAKEAGAVCWMFEKFGFTPEGVHRRGGFSASDGQWRDVHVLAMLDTDWILLEGRSTGRAGITTPWDTLMERHEKEREMMSEWMEDPSWGRLRRTGSMETVRAAADSEPDEYEAYDDSDMIPAPLAPSGSGGGNLADAQEPQFEDARSTPSSVFGLSEAESYDEDLELQVGSSGSPSSVGFSPPASVVSLPSDFEWRSVGPSVSSQPSVASPPPQSHSSWQELSPPHADQIRQNSPPIFSLDSGDENTSFWDSDPNSEFDDEGLGAGLQSRRGRYPDM
ncbi:GNAT family acetyltransferase [Ceratobasidium sp. AG-Ba]|nr:GNAT family acetyltransferase [Ceratobasidium sp. AG-Ba]